MSRQSIDQGPTDQSRGAGHQNAHARSVAVWEWCKRTLVSGSTASIISTVVVTAFARPRTGRASSGMNATSHWVWGERAMWKHAPTLRYTAVGYAIHHASSLWWAGIFEAMAHKRSPKTVAGLAAATTVTAYLVDYHVVPRRLTPGFDRHLPASGMVATYGAFGLGLVAAHLMLREVRHRAALARHAPPRRTRSVPATRTTPGQAPAPSPTSARARRHRGL